VVQEESELKWGALLGVVALTTNQPYFSTVVATGKRACLNCCELCRCCCGAAVRHGASLRSLYC
jgi:hypothetical protein